MRLLTAAVLRMPGTCPSICEHHRAASLGAVLYAQQKSILKWRKRLKLPSEKPKRMKSTRRIRETKGIGTMCASFRLGLQLLPHRSRDRRKSYRTSLPHLNLYPSDECPVEDSRLRSLHDYQRFFIRLSQQDSLVYLCANPRASLAIDSEAIFYACDSL